MTIHSIDLECPECAELIESGEDVLGESGIIDCPRCTQVCVWVRQDNKEFAISKYEFLT